jgi:hypothetical protein
MANEGVEDRRGAISALRSRTGTTRLMARLNWDRELREARKRKHGTIPVWADPSALSLDDERQVDALLDPLVNLLADFRAMSRTQQGQRRSEFEFRLRKLRDQALGEAAGIPNLAARQAVRGRAELLIQNLRGGAS